VTAFIHDLPPGQVRHAKPSDVIAKTTFHVSWFVKASVQQGLKSCLCVGARQRGEERIPLDFDLLVGRQAAQVHQALRVRDRLLVE
jgi:hypothetical protein